MNILSQNLKELLKNNLKVVFDKFKNEIVDIFIDNFVSPSRNKYIDIFEDFDEISRRLLINIIVESLETFDNQYKISKDRKSKYYISKSNIPRTITTIYGDITFHRTYYKDKTNNKYIFILDELLGLNKYERYDPIVKGIAINLSFKGNQKQSSEIISQIINPIKANINTEVLSTIPRQSVYNWINKWNVPDYKYLPRPDVKSLFIMVDEKFIGCQNLENDIMIKSFVSFEGVVNISKGRRKLVNRLIYNINSKSAWTDYIDFLYSIYDSEVLENIYLLSDGGNWIKTGINELKMSPNQTVKRLLCEFHFKQAINRITTDKDYRKILLLSFNDDSKLNFINNVESLIFNSSEREEKIRKNLNYIVNNYKAIKDMINFGIGSSMESHISHYIANQFASRPKGYSSKTINKYIKINDYKCNGLNIFNLYLNSYNNKEVITINTENKYTDDIYQNNSNIPMLYSGIYTDTRLDIKNHIN